MRLLTLKTILVATDLDEGSRPALITARDLARAAGASVHVVHVSDDAKATEATAALLSEVGLPPEDAAVHVVQGDPSHAINLLRDKIGADTIIVGPHRARREAEGRDALGSTALALVTNAAVPCMVTTRALRIPLARTLAAVDISDSARGTLAVALSWTSALRAQRDDTDNPAVLTVLHVRGPVAAGGRPATANSTLDAIVNEVRQEAGSWAGAAIDSVTTDSADAADGIVEYAKRDRADLVVLGTRGLGIERVGRIGSIAAAVMKKLDAPVLLVPPAVWMEVADQSA